MQTPVPAAINRAGVWVDPAAADVEWEKLLPGFPLQIHRAFATLRRFLPDRVGRFVREAGTAFLTPFYFAYSTGHFRSSLHSKALDKTGLPLPWYTYPAIQQLQTKSFAGRSVLEFGAGQSTLWWARKAASIVSFEANADWYHLIRTQLPANAAVHLADAGLTDFEELVPTGSRFDVIVVDGLDRLVAATKSFQRLTEGGVLILDNSEGYWGPRGTYPIVDLLHNAGYARVDYYGFSAANILPHCTSFFFRDRCFLFEVRDHPVSLGTVNRYGDGS